jgi:sugar-specific transcriptional regulator TrmB
MRELKLQLKRADRQLASAKAHLQARSMPITMMHKDVVAVKSRIPDTVSAAQNITLPMLAGKSPSHAPL